MPTRLDEIALKTKFKEAQKLHLSGNIARALRAYKHIENFHKNSSIFTFMALAFLQSGRTKEARDYSHKAVSMIVNTDNIRDRVVLSTVLRRLGELSLAEKLLRDALSADPDNSPAKNNLALILLQRNLLEDADHLFSEAQHGLKDDASPTLNRVRIALLEQDYEKVENLLLVARDIQPGHIDLPLLEAKLAIVDMHYDKAARLLFKTLIKKPVHIEAITVLLTLSTSSIPIEALDHLFYQVIKIKPSSARLLGMLVSLARKHLAWKHLFNLEMLLNEALENDQDAVIDVASVFLLLSSNISQKAHRIASHNSFEKFVGRPFNKERLKPLPLNNRKIRIGYLSSDFKSHPIGHVTVGVFEAHNRQEFEFIGYSNSGDDGSEVRKRIQNSFDRFVNVADLSDHDLAVRMREDKIDILIDLNQMTAGHRLGVFLQSPSPVTANWLGMPGTVGAGKLVDYIIMDSWTANPLNLDGFDETPVILSGSYQPNDWKKPDFTVSESRLTWNLPEKSMVFCSFNQTQKFSPDTILLWSQILAKVPDSILWVVAGEKAIEDRFLAIFSENGISSDRIIFAQKVPYPIHRVRLKHADLMLDNWPYNSHATCADSLRAGTPILTLPQNTFASRVAASILATAGLDEWISSSPDEYVQKAIAWGQRSFEDRQRMKVELSEKYWSGPMVDCHAFARRLENFYRFAIQRAIDGKEPTPLTVAWNGDIREGLPSENEWMKPLATR